MTRDEFRQFLREKTVERQALMTEVKQRTYAGADDAHGNFKRRALVTGLSPEQIMEVDLQKHWDVIRHGNWREDPEGLDGRFGDLLNYLELLWAYLSAVAAADQVSR